MAKRREDLVFQVPQQSSAPVIVNAPPTTPMSFEAWFATKQHVLRMKPEMKLILKKHFDARGFTQTGDWDSGLKDFGL